MTLLSSIITSNLLSILKLDNSITYNMLKCFLACNCICS